jgi:hypothetical protein
MPYELQSLQDLPKHEVQTTVRGNLKVAMLQLQLLRDEHLCGAGDETHELVGLILGYVAEAKAML